MSTNIATIHNSTPPSGEALSRVDKYLRPHAPNAIAILEEHEELHYEERARFDAKYNRILELDEELVPLLREQDRNNRQVKPDEAVAKRTAKAIDQIKKKQKKLRETTPGPANFHNYLQEFVGTINRPYRDAGTADALIGGETPKTMYELECRARIADAKDQLKKAKAAPAPENEVRANIIASVDALAKSPTVAPAKKHRGRVQFAQDRVYRGLDHFADVPDPMALLCDVFGDHIKKTLFERAMFNYDPANALSTFARRQAIADAEAAILLAERQACFWHRQCRSEGIDPGPAYITNPVAVLDIEPM